MIRTLVAMGVSVVAAVGISLLYEAYTVAIVSAFFAATISILILFLGTQSEHNQRIFELDRKIVDLESENDDIRESMIKLASAFGEDMKMTDDTIVKFQEEVDQGFHQMAIIIANQRDGGQH